MYKKIAVVLIAGALLVTGLGCSKKDDSATQTQNSQTNSSVTGTDGQLPAGHPSIDGANAQNGQATPAKPINGDEVAKKISDDLDKKFPGDWAVSGTNLKKGSYTENGNYKIVDEVATLYPGSMVSLFVGEKRISGTIKGQDGKPVLEGYPTPPEVGETMKSGKIKVVNAGSIGSSSYQKVYMPIKSGNKTIAVMTISIAQ